MLKQRVITALILAPLVVAGIIFSSVQVFTIAALIVLLLGALEWAELAGLPLVNKVIYLVLMGAVCVAIMLGGVAAQAWTLYFSIPLWAVLLWWVKSYPNRTAQWSASWCRALIGLAILIPAWVSLALLKHHEPRGFLILLLMLIIWAADIGAYFSGKKFGRTKLAPQVSPGKTWEGVFGGLLAALLACWLFAFLFGLMDVQSIKQLLLFALVAAVTGAVSILGDLTESMIKRFRGVKDSGKLLPGHGGVMDRIDSLVAGLPFYALLMTYLVQQ